MLHHPKMSAVLDMVDNLWPTRIHGTFGDDRDYLQSEWSGRCALIGFFTQSSSQAESPNIWGNPRRPLFIIVCSESLN